MSHEKNGSNIEEVHPLQKTAGDQVTEVSDMRYLQLNTDTNIEIRLKTLQSIAQMSIMSRYEYPFNAPSPNVMKKQVIIMKSIAT